MGLESVEEEVGMVLGPTEPELDRNNQAECGPRPSHATQPRVREPLEPSRVDTRTHSLVLVTPPCSHTTSG